MHSRGQRSGVAASNGVRTVCRHIATHVLLYLLSADTAKADIAERILQAGGTISVQVLNEFAAVASRKLKMANIEIAEILSMIRAECTVVPLTVEVHILGLQISAQYGLSTYDAMIVSVALNADCSTLWSEDMHHGLVIEKRLKIQNPFRQF